MVCWTVLRLPKFRVINSWNRSIIHFIVPSAVIAPASTEYANLIIFDSVEAVHIKALKSGHVTLNCSG